MKNNVAQKSSSLRKAPPFSKLTNLPDAQFNALKHWLIDDQLSYRQCVNRLKEQFSIECAQQSVARFWKIVCAPAILRRSIESRQAREGLPALSLDLFFVLRQGNVPLAKTSLNCPISTGQPPGPDTAVKLPRRNNAALNPGGRPARPRKPKS